MKKKILILGGSGFVGMNLSKFLSKKNFNVLSTYCTKKPKKISKVKFIKLNLNSNFFDRKILKDVYAVFVCSANSSGAKIMTNNPSSHFEDNVKMNLNLVRNLQGSNIKKIVFFSSSTVYPDTKKNCRENDVNHKFFEKYKFTGNGKLISEKMYELYARELKKKIDLLIIRPSNLYGPFDKFEREKSKVIPSLIRKAIESKNILRVWGNGSDIKDFIYIDDFIDMTYKLFKLKHKFLVVNVCSSKPVILKKIILEIRNQINKNLKIYFEKNKFKMIPVRKVSNKYLKSLINVKLNYTISQGLTKTIEWYKKNKNDSK